MTTNKRLGDYVAAEIDAIRSKPRAEWTDEEFETIIGYETALRIEREEYDAECNRLKSESEARVKASQDAHEKALAEFESIREWMKGVQR